MTNFTAISIVSTMTTLGTRVIFVCLGLIISAMSSAQGIEDAVRLNTREVLGTARNLGLGSTMGSVGGDLSGAASNPASLTVYRTNEWSFSPGFVLHDTETSTQRLLDGRSTTSDDRSNFVIPSGGYVSVQEVLSPSLVQTNFAIGINRIADFNQKFSYDTRYDRSIVSSFVQGSGTLPPGALNAYREGPAFDANVISQVDSAGNYGGDVDVNTLVRKQETVDRWGGIDELFLAYALKFRSNVSLGFSMSIPIMKYDEERRYRESDADDPSNPGSPNAIFRELAFDLNSKIRGTGFNIKVGGKVEINRWLHVGGAVHTPTWWRITDEFTTRVEYDYVFDPEIFSEPGPGVGVSPDIPLEYSYNTPWRFLGSVAARVKRLGFVFSEIEYQVASEAGKFSFDEPDGGLTDELNRDIEANLDKVMNIRVGAEARIRQHWRVRGGLNLGNSPFVFLDEGIEMQSWSAGVGRWWGRYFLDLGYRMNTIDQSYLPYDVQAPGPTVADVTGNRHYFILTGGVRLD